MPRLRVRRYRYPRPGRALAFVLFALGLLAAWVFFSSGAFPQERKTFAVPFHTANGLILLDVQLNGKPAVLLLDTGSVRTIVNFESIGAKVKGTQPVKPSEAGKGATGQYAKAHVNLGLGDIVLYNQEVLAVDLSEVSKMLGTRVDGLLGADALREFSAVRINFKTATLGLEQ